MRAKFSYSTPGRAGLIQKQANVFLSRPDTALLLTINSTENNTIKGDVIKRFSESEYENKTGCNVCSKVLKSVV